LALNGEILGKKNISEKVKVYWRRPLICSSIFFLLDHNKIVAKVKKFKVVISKIRAQSERKSKKKCLGGNKKV
jgi:hypothetical protein